MSIDDLGKPLSRAYAIAGGQARLYERGMTISSAAGAFEMPWDFPMIGKPTIAAGTFEHVLRQIDWRSWPREEVEVAVAEALRDRLSLVAVGQPAVRVALAGDLHLTAIGLQDRQLYDIAVNGDEGWHVVAPHAVYARQGWTDFGLVHITDMHVSRRIDSFRKILRDAGREAGAARLYNWNDRFRGFVRYANHLHAIGVLDVIIATGDNYDYQFEIEDDVDTSGGNAAFLRDLILGKAPGPDFPDVEELRAPIFLIPGNHDYRKYPYGLVFDLHAGDNVVGRADLLRVPNYNGFRLSTEDAALLANHLEGRQGASVPNVLPHEAERMVEVDENLRAYRQHLVGLPGSYVIALGAHRIVMIDSAYDLGTPKDLIDAARIRLGFGSEDEDAFIGASPNCRGVTAVALGQVREALAASDPSGLFIVGLHAPLFNPPHDDYCYFLRETQRAVQRDQVHGFLARDGVTVVAGSGVTAQVEKNHPTWFPDPAAEDRRPPSYVKRVSSEDHFDHGVSRGEAEELMHLLATRPADLVLAGHTHCYNEYRVKKAQDSDELVYYMDFYTQNPTNYYPTKFLRSWVPPTRSEPGYRVTLGETYVEVTPGAAPDATPWPMPFGALTPYMLQVPPYAHPLSSAPDARAWWAEHRPLVLQTGALGPFKKTEFFTGFRVIAVKNDVIDKIHYVSIDRLEKHQYGIDWEKAIEPEPPRHYQYVERSRPLGSPLAVGRPAAISFQSLGAIVVVYRDAEGRLHELWQKGNDAGTSDLTALASNAMRAEGDPSLYIDPVDNLVVALYRGTDEHVYSMYWSTGEVRRDALTASVDAPRAAGTPVGYVGADGYRHVIYETGEGHVHELFWTGANPPGHGDISKSGFHAYGDPVAYQKPSNGENVVIYRGEDTHIHGLYWTTGTPRHDELSRVAQAPPAAGNPAAYYTSFDDVQQIVYRSLDGHLHELWWQGDNPVGHSDLTARTVGAPVAAYDGTGDPVAYYNPDSNTKHVIYRSSDGHLNELSWAPGAGRPTWIDLTAYAVAPLAADKPCAFAEAPNTQHVFYRGNDHQIHEIRWSGPVRSPIEEAFQPGMWNRPPIR